MAKNEDLLHRGAAEVEIAVLEAEFLVGLGGTIDFERGRWRGVEDFELSGADLDCPSLELGVFLAREPGVDDSSNADDVLVAQIVRGSHRAGTVPRVGTLRLEDDLSQTIAIAQVDEDQAAVVATGIDPAVEDDLLADVVSGQLAAGLSPFEHGRR